MEFFRKYFRLMRGILPEEFLDGDCPFWTQWTDLAIKHPVYRNKSFIYNAKAIEFKKNVRRELHSQRPTEFRLKVAKRLVLEIYQRVYSAYAYGIARIDINLLDDPSMKNIAIALRHIKDQDKSFSLIRILLHMEIQP